MPWALLLLVLAAPDPAAEHIATLERHAKAPYEQREREKAVRALGTLAGTGSLTAIEALVGLLEDPFAHIQDEAVSALAKLGRLHPPLKRSPPVIALASQLKSRKPAVRRHVATALGLIRDGMATFTFAEVFPRERDPAVVAAMAEALARIGGDEALAPLLARKRPEGRAAVVRALGHFPGAPIAPGDTDDVKAAYVDALARRKEPVWPEHEGAPGPLLGMALADALPATEESLARARAAALCAHPSWRVRAAAIDGVRARRDASLLPLLVDRLEKEEGRLRVDAWNALRALTGKDLPPVAADWRAVLPLADLPAAGAAAALPKSSATYFGLPVVSRRMAFVFDVSGSMRDDGKIEKARAAFARTAAQLGKRQRYDLFVYRYYLKYPPRPKLERAFGKLIAGRAKAAARWLAKQEAKGGGAIYDALAAALDDPDVDTIYLLSDGVPSYGTVKRGYRVLQETRRRNRFRRVVIHTILLGSKGTDETFMKDLAAATGGVAVDAAGRRLR